jgi:hypothetical protein
MAAILKWGIILGLLVEIWTYVMGFTGWYKHPTLLFLFFLVILIQIVVLVIALRETAAQGRRYWGQVSAGTLISVVAGLIIVGGSLLFSTVVFPDYVSEVAQVQEQMLRQAGQSEEQIRSAMEAYNRSNSPTSLALQGFIGTFLTGLVTSLVVAGFVRAK